MGTACRFLKQLQYQQRTIHFPPQKGIMEEAENEFMNQRMGRVGRKAVLWHNMTTSLTDSLPFWLPTQV